MEYHLKEHQKSLVSAQDDIDGRREGLINNIMARLKTESQNAPIFTINWHLS